MFSSDNKITCLRCGYRRTSTEHCTNQLCHGSQLQVVEKSAYNVLASERDELKLIIESYRAKLVEVGHHISDIEHSCKRYGEVGKENIAIVKILPAIKEARAALDSE